VEFGESLPKPNPYDLILLTPVRTNTILECTSTYQHSVASSDTRKQVLPSDFIVPEVRSGFSESLSCCRSKTGEMPENCR
jgi:hypothetical protein